MSKPIVLIFGVGKNIGAATAKTFLANGYRVASASRSMNPADSVGDSLFLVTDVSDLKNISNVFETVRKTWGEPSVVIYNAAARHVGDPKDMICSTPLSVLQSHMEINTISPFVAAQEAVKSFDALPTSAGKLFLYTGNVLNEQRGVPSFLSLGMGKNAIAYMIAEATASYKEKGYRFYYVDERVETGDAAGDGIDGQAHADVFLGLANGNLEGPWQFTFVKGLGYKRFPRREV